MPKQTSKKWKLVFNQRNYFDGDQYVEGDNQAFLECPYCGKKNDYNIISEPKECIFCGMKVEGTE